MRNVLCDALVREARRKDFVFLTGDLGYGALEPLQSAAGSRFINAGVAEQNMVSVAAGLAKTGLSPWAYSIAAFIYARPFEQIRNDVCLHDLPVKLVGNGGGYGYGVMGGSHHGIEDYGALLCLQHMRVFVPAFREDVAPIVRRLADFQHPAYLRLGRCEKPADFILPDYAPWRKLMDGNNALILIVGPIVGTYISEIAAIPEADRPSLWVVSELPISPDEIPAEFLEELFLTKRLVVVEEHVAQGGAGQMLAYSLLKMGRSPERFSHYAAKGYVSGSYGSQQFHRKECALDAKTVIAEVISTR